MATKDIVGPFRVAFGGIVHTFRTQRHMRVFLYATLIVVLGAILLNMRIREILVLLFMVTLVLVAEMFNSAIEAVVDLVSPSYNPLAKFAKDISAGAVLITSIMAIIVGAMIAIGDDQWERFRVNLTTHEMGVPVALRLILGLGLVGIVVIIGKGLGKRGQLFRGGLISGHAAIGFFLATSTIFLVNSVLVSAIAIILASLVAQSRWEAKFHSVFELTMGATAGAVLGVLLFATMPK
ncbi:MAG: diacylglycerol kinase [Armatimonadetes bacterium]|nr:diacylglycerol kinase [Armatimonadota bacterium]